MRQFPGWASRAAENKGPRLAFVMVGLPARGKSYIARKLARYLRWLGHDTRVFNVGSYRRELLGAKKPHDFFSPDNPEGQALRLKVAEVALEDMLGWMDRGLQIGGRDLGARRNMPQVDADAGHDAVLERILVDRHALLAEVARRIDVRAAMIRHREEHHGVAVHVAGLGEGFLVRLPDAVDDGRLPRIARRAVIKLA